MDTKSFPKTTLFDQISFLMVGAIAAGIVIFDAAYFFTVPFPVIDFGSVLVWLVAAYFVGHLIQVISNVIRDIPILPLLDWEATKLEFLPHEEDLLKEAADYFGAHAGKTEHLWNLCYMLGMTKDAAGQVETFSAYYNLYRGWFVTFFLESLFLVYVLVTAYTPATLTLFLVSSIIAILFYRRSKRFWQYLRDKVFGMFIITKSSKL